jgi:putrescine---pyruvate transaminase
MLGKVDDLTRISLAHSIFPLVPKDDLDADGPTILVKGDGVTVTDQYGNTLLDMMSAVTRAASLGYGNREIAQAMYDQAAKMHYSGTGRMTSVPATLLAEKLAAITPGRLSKVTFTSGGSEATEAALKIAKQYLQQSGKKPRAFKVISRWSSYHGATMAALSCTDWLPVRDVPDPRVPGHSFVANPMRYRNPLGLDEKTYSDVCVAHLERQIQLEDPELIAAFIGEPFQQANGVQIPLPDYWTKVRQLCDKYGIILIIDEVITGFGRTGTWFATEQIGIEPDIMNVAKSMGAGYAPIGAVITRDEIADGIKHFRHVHTYSGHAVSCAVALKVIEIMERDGLVERSDTLARSWQDDMRATFGSHPIVGDIRGRGFWQAIDFTADKSTKAAFQDDTVKEIARRTRQHGVLVSPIGTAIEIAPPLVSSEIDLRQCTSALAKAIDEVARERGLA